MVDLGTVLSAAQALFAALECSLIHGVFSTLGYKSELQRLKTTVTTITNVLFDAGNKSVELNETAQAYIQELKDAVYDADDLFDEFLTLAELKHQSKKGSLSKKVNNFCSSNNPLKVAYSMSRDIKNIRQNLNDIADDHAKFGFSADTPSLLWRKREETSSFVNSGGAVGREGDVTSVICRLLDSTEDVGFLTIVGVGGLGKTTLAKLVFSDDRIMTRFPLRLWVCVSDQDENLLNEREVLSKILESAGCKKPDINSSLERVQREYEDHLGKRKYLIVLDDLWNENPSKWHKLRELLMIGGSGSRIIATTRSEETARVIGNGAVTKTNTYVLNGLSPEDSWRLFDMMAFNEGSKRPQFIEIGEKIVRKCCNLPLAIMVIGSCLNGLPIDEWKSIEAISFNESSKGKDIMDILKFSYDNLEPSLKSCFAYCALFPKNYIISKELLGNLWEAQGYIVPFDEGQSIDKAIEKHFSTLLKRCFFQDVKKNEYGDVKSVKIHDLMHDLAKKVSGKEICVINSSVVTKLARIARHVFEGRIINDEEFIVESKIRSYLMFRRRWNFEFGRQLPTAFVCKIAKSWGCLRALSLQGLRVRSLPDTMGNLLHLRYLNLSKNSMKKLPDTIVKLHNLQTLNLNRCDELKEWPKEFSKLVNLKHLYREKCYELRCMPIGMNKLSHLRVLTNFVVEDESSNGMQHVGQLEDLKALSVNVKNRLVIQFHVNFTRAERYEWEGSCLEGSEHLKEVEIHFSFPSPVLYLRRMDVERRVKEEVVMEKLQPHRNLMKFHLSYYAGDIITGWGRAEDNWGTFLPNLVYIKLSDCYRLQQLPLLSKLLHLKSLYLLELKNLKYVEEEEISGCGSGSLDTEFFPALEFLEVRALKNLLGWSRTGNSRNSNEQPAFPRLSELIIQNCPLLLSFPHCLSLPKLDLRNNNEALRIVTGK